jgi:3,4-dihydroxy 2-butanone 4-phosphate synthase/GTP cyclohydrolase II
LGAINRVKEAINEIKKGNMVIMLDDEDRENEGDLVYAASLTTPEKVNFMATHAKGLICVSVNQETANRLELYPMVSSNTSAHETAFTVSVDAKSATTGISASERNDTIAILANPISKIDELVKPGHIFPLIGKKGGVLVRTGHTEGSIDLCKLSGFGGEAVICEIMKKDGTMARRPDLDIFAKEHNMKMVYISDIIEYRMANESLVQEISCDKIDFFGTSAIKRQFKDHFNNIHTLVQIGDVKPLMHIKFHNVDSDIELFLNADKLNSLLKTINFLKDKGGIIAFLQYDGEKKKNMKDFGIGAQILKKLGIEEIKLLTSGGKHSFSSLTGFGLNIKEEIQIEG